MRRTRLLAGGILWMLLLGPTGPGEAYAQSNANANATVRVDIVNGLTLLIDAQLHFGTVVNNQGTVSIAKTDGNAGVVRIRGQQNKNLTIDVSTSQLLENGASSIPLTPGASYNTENNPTTSTDLVFNNGVANQVTGFKIANNLAGNQGQAWIWLWGSIELNDPGLPSGTYTGSYSISVAYQ